MELPQLFPFHGNWDAYEDELYEIFLDTIVRKTCVFRGYRVSCQMKPLTKNKGYGFWHIVSEGENDEERTPDLRRCERIRWVSWMISNAEKHPDLSWWENERRGKTHVVIWHEQENFVVILAKRTDYYVLKTAYLAKSHRRETFKKERAAFLID